MSCFHGRCCWTSITTCSRALFLQLHTSCQLQKSYYDSLEVTAKATQGDIKKAYYKLSLKYHPDISSGHGEKFREITAAYEVLGNLKLRRLYDRGALNLGDHPPPDVSHAPQMDLSAFDTRRTKSPTTGRTAEFNFDDWSKAHYGRVFAHKEKLKEKHKIKQRAEEYNRRRGIVEWVLLVALLGLGLGVSLMSFQTRHYDSPSKSKDKDR